MIGENGSKIYGFNVVLSMVYYYLNVSSYGEIVCYFYVDNCVGQNKNKMILYYFVWCCCIG